MTNRIGLGAGLRRVAILLELWSACHWGLLGTLGFVCSICAAVNDWKITTTISHGSLKAGPQMWWTMWLNPCMWQLTLLQVYPSRESALGWEQSGMRRWGNMVIKRSRRGKRHRRDWCSWHYWFLIWSWINHGLINPGFIAPFYCPFIYFCLNLMEVWLIKFCSFHVFKFLNSSLHWAQCSRWSKVQLSCKSLTGTRHTACRESPHVSQLNNSE